MNNEGKRMPEQARRGFRLRCRSDTFEVREESMVIRPKCIPEILSARSMGSLRTKITYHTCAMTGRSRLALCPCCAQSLAERLVGGWLLVEMDMKVQLGAACQLPSCQQGLWKEGLSRYLCGHHRYPNRFLSMTFISLC